MTLVIYFILVMNPPYAEATPSPVTSLPMRWEFMAIEHVSTRAYCEYLARDVNKAFSNTPGNVRILCADDEGSEA